MALHDIDTAGKACSLELSPMSQSCMAERRYLLYGDSILDSKCCSMKSWDEVEG